jgi:hypothetical protein
MKSSIVAIALFSPLLSASLSEATLAQNIPQTCIPLEVVDGNGSQVQKRVSLPGALTSRSNWNTDFGIPGNQSFQRYIVTIKPLNQAKYQVQMFLKYSNGTADKFYDQSVTLPVGQEFSIEGVPRLNTFPYQVNVSVGGLSALGNTYKVFAMGCY